MGKKPKTVVGKILKTALGVGGALIPGLKPIHDLAYKEGTTFSDVLTELTKADIPVDQKLAIQQQLIEAQQTEEEELTKRAIADAASDSKLARNIRPATYIFFIVLFSFSMVLDSFDSIPFNITNAQLEVIQGTLFAMTGFYFGGRSLEKIVKAYKETK